MSHDDLMHRLVGVLAWAKHDAGQPDSNSRIDPAYVFETVRDAIDCIDKLKDETARLSILACREEVREEYPWMDSEDLAGYFTGKTAGFTELEVARINKASFDFYVEHAAQRLNAYIEQIKQREADQ